MWNLNPDFFASAEERLNGRRARLTNELASIAADLEELETLRHAAYAFAAKHISEQEPEQTAASLQRMPEASALAPEVTGEEAKEEAREATPAPRAEEGPAPAVETAEAPNADLEAQKENHSRWRFRMAAGA